MSKQQVKQRATIDTGWEFNDALHSAVYWQLNEEWRETDWDDMTDDIRWYEFKNWYIEAPSTIYVLVVSDGDLYRSRLTLTEDDKPQLGTPQRVIQQFVPQTNRTTTVWRSAKDGHYYLLARSCSAVLNKEGEIDSTLLFADMEDRFRTHMENHAEDAEAYPLRRRNVMHDRAVTIGDVIHVSAEENFLITLTRMDKTPIAEAVAQAVQNHPDKYGDSHEFASHATERVVLRTDDGDEIEYLAHIEGEFLGVASCTQARACAYLTSNAVFKERTMKKMTRTELEGFINDAGADVSILDAFEQETDKQNRTISEMAAAGEIIVRTVKDIEAQDGEGSAEDEPASEPAMQPEGDDFEERVRAIFRATPVEIELDDASREQVVRTLLDDATLRTSVIATLRTDEAFTAAVDEMVRERVAASQEAETQRVNGEIAKLRQEIADGTKGIARTQQELVNELEDSLAPSPIKARMVSRQTGKNEAPTMTMAERRRMNKEARQAG